MKRKGNKNIWIVLFIILIGGLLFINASGLFDEKIKIPNSEKEIIDNCKNLDLENSVDCLVKNVKKFYKYNYTNGIGDILDFNELKNNGGDCRDWAFLYERLGKGLGLTSTSYGLDRNGNGKSDHRFAIISNGSYCIIDQTTYWCKELKNGEE